MRGPTRGARSREWPSTDGPARAELKTTEPLDDGIARGRSLSLGWFLRGISGTLGSAPVRCYMSCDRMAVPLVRRAKASETGYR